MADRRGHPSDTAHATTSLTRLCSLDDPTRRRLYAYVTAQHEPVSRDQATAALDLDRSTVAYHLDRLVEHGLLATSFARPEGRRGPGAGRPTKFYERVGEEITVSVPPRDYELVARVLARASEHDPSGALRRAVAEAASAEGRELAERMHQPPDDLLGVLARLGFEPFRDGAVIRLRNCPFHRLAQEHTELVCGMNVALLEAVARRSSPTASAHLDPSPTRCCVALAT